MEILKRFGMFDCKAIATPMASRLKLLSDASSNTVNSTIYCQMIVSLMYLTNTRPNICFAVNTLSQFLTNLRHVYLIVTKYVLRYLKGTVDYGLKYDVNQNINLHGYVDSNWVGSATDGKRTSCYCFNLGFGMISWFSRKKSCVELGTTEEEYVPSCSASCKEVWM